MHHTLTSVNSTQKHTRKNTTVGKTQQLQSASPVVLLSLAKSSTQLSTDQSFNHYITLLAALSMTAQMFTCAVAASRSLLAFSHTAFNRSCSARLSANRVRRPDTCQHVKDGKRSEAELAKLSVHSDTTLTHICWLRTRPARLHLAMVFLHRSGELSKTSRGNVA